MHASGVVQVRALSKSYGDFVAVRDLTLAIEPGEVFGLLGPNGAGKTTTMKMLMGVLRASGGSATIGGFDCFEQRAEVMRRVGYLPDEPVFYDYLRGREIVRFVAEMHGLDAQASERRCGELVERFELGEAMADYAVNYSRGMKKKLGLIVALVHDPDLLILDEPTNGLDPLATRNVHDLVRDLSARGKTVLLSTHLLEQAQRLCSRAAILNRGRLVTCGTLAELSTGGRSLEEVFFDAIGGAENP
ncbi:MAG TPA: ABC transporter ATP-binding protein [Polyangiaceae bacterium]|jgi:ABC-2 type transport system ATP-binding protein|nr:ABC transporter ATP-binding protein [Polyangiaceae bacterium]